MADVVYLHVGAPKTGTTYLQDRLAANKSRLARHDVNYPTGLRTDMFLAALDLVDRPWGGLRADAHGEWAALAKRVRRTNGTAIVSHEILGAARPERIRMAWSSFGDAELHVVYTARDLARQVPAEWQERVKHRRVVPFRRFVRRLHDHPQHKDARRFWRAQGLPDVLTRWGSGLPPERVHLVTVPPPGADPGELWRRFCRTVGIDPTWDLADSARRNPSLGAAETLLLRRLNRRLRDTDLQPDDYRRLVRGLLAHETLAHREDVQPVRLPESAHAWAAEVADEWVEWVVGSGIDVVGDVDDLRPRPFETTDPPARAVDNPKQTEVVDAALDAIVALLAETTRRRDPDAAFTARVAKVAKARRR